MFVMLLSRSTQEDSKSLCQPPAGVLVLTHKFLTTSLKVNNIHSQNTKNSIY